MTPQDMIAPRKGLLHVVDAAGYSAAGAARLWQETAARLEVLGAGLGALALYAVGASLTQYLILAGLVLAVLVVEALNTAIEVLVDRISPEWSLHAKHAKDLGSLAVGLTLLATGGYLMAVVVPRLI